jgi:hypothetical protein
MLGMKGNFMQGLSRLSNYLRRYPQNDAPFHEEGLFYEAFIRFNFGGEKQAVWQRISNDSLFPVAGNLMRSFFRANLAISFRKAEVALNTLKAVESIPSSRAWPVFDFETGSALLLRLDPACLAYFDRYIERNKGGLFTKDALQMAALACYLRKDYQAARIYRNRIPHEGNLHTDADKQAQRFAKTDSWPHQILLSARLLIDGGYATEALQKLRNASAIAFSAITDRLEYDFRLGRALEETGDAAGAVQAYQRESRSCSGLSARNKFRSSTP